MLQPVLYAVGARALDIQDPEIAVRGSERLLTGLAAEHSLPTPCTIRLVA